MYVFFGLHALLVVNVIKMVFGLKISAFLKKIQIYFLWRRLITHMLS